MMHPIRAAFGALALLAAAAHTPGGPAVAPDAMAVRARHEGVRDVTTELDGWHREVQGLSEAGPA